jgi:hypothetical protein
MHEEISFIRLSGGSTIYKDSTQAQLPGTVVQLSEQQA